MKHLKVWSISIASAVALLLEILIKSARVEAQNKINYYFYLCIGFFAVSIVLSILSYLNKTFGKKLEYKSLFIAGIILFICGYNLITDKFDLVPTIYFPSPSRVLGVLVEDRSLILKCLAYSSRLLSVGFFGGALVGIATGILIGFNKHVA
jgi:NitT/TauT family transport system permease protein